MTEPDERAQQIESLLEWRELIEEVLVEHTRDLMELEKLKGDVAMLIDMGFRFLRQDDGNSAEEGES